MSEDTLSQPYILVIGAAGLDSKGRAAIPLTLGSSTPGTVRVSVGGVARNVADNLARLGVDTVLLSAIGTGGSGQRVVDSATAVGINTDYLIYSDEYYTASYLAVVDEKGNLAMSVDDMQIMSCLTPQTIENQRELFINTEMIVLDSNLASDTIEKIFKVAKRHNVRVCADPTSVTLATKLQPYLSDIYMLTPNVPEAELLANVTINDRSEAITAAQKLVQAGVEIAVITLGEAGIVYASSNQSGHIPALAMEVVDPTGASHALTATVVFGLLNDIDLDESVRLAASAAALTLACTDTVCADLSLDLLYDHLII